MQLQEVHNSDSPSLVTTCITVPALAGEDVTSAIHLSATFLLLQNQQRC